MAILPLVFDLTTLKGQPIGWSNAATDAFLSRTSQKSTLMLAQLTPDIHLYRNPELPTGKANSMYDRDMYDSPVLRQLVGDWALGNTLFQHTYRRNTLEQALQGLMWTYEAQNRALADVRATQSEIWLTPSCLFMISNTLSQLPLLRNYTTYEPAWTTVLGKGASLPPIADSTPYVVCLAPELAEGVSSHVRLNVYSEIHLQLRYLVAMMSRQRSTSKPAPESEVLAPVHAGSVFTVGDM
jgi:hypothetical protein